MILTREAFIAAFPEFTDTGRYPPAQFAFWAGQADLNLSEARFGASLELASMLFVAHYITLSAQSARAAASGNGVAVGAPLSVASSKSIDKVSVSYDLNLTAFSGAGPWNATSYGQRFYAMLRGFAAGPVYRVPVRRLGLGYRRVF